MKNIKKIVLLTLLSFVYLFTFDLKAEEIETVITKESVELIQHGNVSFSNIEFKMAEYLSRGYVTLHMGRSTIYTIDLQYVLQHLDYYDNTNVSNIYLEFDIQAVYTGYDESVHQFLSDDSRWDKNTKRVNLGTTIPTSVETEIWFNILGQSGGAPTETPGGVRLYGVRLFVEYTTPVSLFPILHDLRDLPLGSSNFEDLETVDDFLALETFADVDFIERETGVLDLFFNFGDNELYMYKDFIKPDALGNKAIQRMFYFSTKTDQFLWIITELNRDDILDSKYLLWNITDGTFKHITTGITYGMPYVTGNGISTYNMVYVDLVIPWRIDEIIWTKMSYTYRHHYLSGDKGQWVDVVEKTYYEGAKTEIDMPWWSSWTKYASGAAAALILNNQSRDQIRDITNEYDLAKKTEFTEFINRKTDNNVPMTEIFKPRSTVINIFLGQHSKMWSAKLEVKDVVLIEMKYVTDGVEHVKTFEKIDQVIPDPDPPTSIITDPLKDLADRIAHLFNSLWLFVCIGAGVGTTVFLTKHRWFKNKLLLVGAGILVFIFLRFGISWLF